MCAYARGATIHYQQQVPALDALHKAMAREEEVMYVDDASGVELAAREEK